MNKLTAPALAALALLMAAGVATAGPRGPMAAGGPGFLPPMLEKFDANGDGTLTKDEIEAAGKAAYAEANTDGADGVTIQEFEPWFWKQHREMMVRAFQRLDADGDGKVTEAEVKSGADRMADRFDDRRGPMGDFGPRLGGGWGNWFGGPDGQRGQGGWFGHHGPRQGGPMMAPPAAEEAPAEAAPAE